jgi:two-component system cell cycle response regulator DivK
MTTGNNDTRGEPPACLVLIVEDNAKNLKLARDVLRFKGFRTIEAATGAAAIALALEARPDVILMDIQLPDMDGGEALLELRANDRTATIPVVALTAFAMREDRNRLLEAGFDGYISKPINVREFPLTVLRYCKTTNRGVQSA